MWEKFVRANALYYAAIAVHCQGGAVEGRQLNVMHASTLFCRPIELREVSLTKRLHAHDVRHSIGCHSRFACPGFPRELPAKPCIQCLLCSMRNFLLALRPTYNRGRRKRCPVEPVQDITHVRCITAPTLSVKGARTLRNRPLRNLRYSTGTRNESPGLMPTVSA